MKTVSIYLFLSLLSYSSVSSQDFLTFKKHIEGGWIVNLDFYEDGVLIADSDSTDLQFYGIDQNLDINHRYTVKGAGAQFYLNDSHLFYAFGEELHTYQLDSDGYTKLTAGDLINYGNFHHNPISYHKENIYFSSGNEYFRYDVSDPNNPVQTGRSGKQESDLNYSLVADDNYIYGSRQLGTGFRNSIRLLDNSQSDTIISKGLYADITSYTADVKKYGDLLILAHGSGLRVYDVSDVENMILKYSYDTDWGRCLEMIDNYIILGSNIGWDVFEISDDENIKHIQNIENDSRIWKLKYRATTNELWSAVDRGNLSGLVIFDVSDLIISTETISSDDIQIFPNPTDGYLTCNFGNQFIETLLISDLTGRHVFEKKNVSQTETIDLSNLSNGIYFITFKYGQEIFTSKIFKG